MVEPIQFGNKRSAESWGLEIAASWAVSRQWKLEGRYTYTRVGVDNSSSTNKSVALEGDTPHHQLRLASFVNLPWNLEFDTTFYWIDELVTERTSASICAWAGARLRPSSSASSARTSRGTATTSSAIARSH